MSVNSVQQIVDGVFLWGGKILLLLEKTSRGRENYWFPPGGKVEDGEKHFSALQRELQEELGLSLEVLRSRQIDLRYYCTHRGVWFGRVQHIAHFLAEVDEPPPIELRVGQLGVGWFSRPPSGGLISETLETLFVCLRLDSYLHQ